MQLAELVSCAASHTIHKRGQFQTFVCAPTLTDGSNCMEQDLDTTVALLTRTPAALSALLAGLPDSWAHAREGEGTWSVYDVVGHLIHGERTDWIARARIILEFGQSRPFEPFDRSAQERESAGKSLPELLHDFASARAQSLRELEALHIGPQDLARKGQHPSLGTVTLAQLLATWAAHDLTHLHQISRILAHQYRDAVGPWQAYLGVMRCSGHSD
ncbi:MAG: hypothetical protein NVSMB62_20270 [Acidobacteriaceae bacterium]